MTICLTAFDYSRLRVLFPTISRNYRADNIIGFRVYPPLCGHDMRFA
jgi:hypothetical protein